MGAEASLEIALGAHGPFATVRWPIRFAETVSVGSRARLVAGGGPEQPREKTSECGQTRADDRHVDFDRAPYDCHRVFPRGVLRLHKVIKGGEPQNGYNDYGAGQRKHRHESVPLAPGKLKVVDVGQW